MNQDSISRFSKHSDDYQKFRPGYPEAVVTYLTQNLQLNKLTRIADVGAGTGIFTKLLASNGYQVVAIEPNAQMRAQAEILVQKYPNLTVTNGRAEKTGLQSKSVDLITVAQSFHWFEHNSTKQEFFRIAKPGAHMLLIWNILQQKSDFLKSYQELKNDYTDRKQYHEKIDIGSIKDFFGTSGIVEQDIYHSRRLNERELIGYFRSSSYSPVPGDEEYPPLEKRISKLFKSYQQNSTVKFEYDAKLFYGKLDG